MADYPLDDDEDDDDIVIDESMFVDLSKMACLLCQRQLTNQETLNKHIQMSQLHKVRFSTNFFLLRYWQFFRNFLRNLLRSILAKPVMPKRRVQAKIRK